jgi:hypothetical protein
VCPDAVCNLAYWSDLSRLYYFILKTEQSCRRNLLLLLLFITPYYYYYYYYYYLLRYIICFLTSIFCCGPTAPVGHDLLILDVSRSHTTTQHSR